MDVGHVALAAGLVGNLVVTVAHGRAGNLGFAVFHAMCASLAAGALAGLWWMGVAP